jgi:hypothetical protein
MIISESVGIAKISKSKNWQNDSIKLAFQAKAERQANQAESKN